MSGTVKLAEKIRAYERRIEELERERDGLKQAWENVRPLSHSENAWFGVIDNLIELERERDALREAAQRLVNDIFESSRLRPFTVACEDVEAFRAALDAEHGAVPERSKWIRSTEALPELSEMVLIAYPASSEEPAIVGATLGENVVRYPDDYPHWMPFPPPPGGE